MCERVRFYATGTLRLGLRVALRRVAAELAEALFQLRDRALDPLELLLHGGVRGDALDGLLHARVNALLQRLELTLRLREQVVEHLLSLLLLTADDLLFIGAYGHSRIVEMVLGSTTEYVVRNAPCPVFMNR